MKIKKFGKTEDAVLDLILPIADNLGYDLWDVCYEKEGATWYLRVFIDKEGGVSIDDAERMTEPVNKILDEKDPIKESYVLEVGSPGIGRRLQRNYQFEAVLGEEVECVRIHAEKGQEKVIIGTLEAFDEERAEIKVNGENYSLDEFSKVSLYEEINF